MPELKTKKSKKERNIDNWNWTSNVNKAHETRDSLISSSSQAVQVYLQPFRCNSLVKCVSQAKIAKNSRKTFFWVKGHSTSSMLINLESPSPVLVIMCSMSVPICNSFHTKQANSGKITSFRGAPIWRPRSRGTPAARFTKFCRDKLESLGQPTMKVSWF